MQYPWAFNRVKLQQSINFLTKQKELNSAIVIDESAIKAEYIKRAGLVKDIPTVDEAPLDSTAATSNPEVSRPVRARRAN